MIALLLTEPLVIISFYLLNQGKNTHDQIVQSILFYDDTKENVINIGSKTLAGIENRVLLINRKILIVLHENFRNTFYSVLYLH